MSLLRLIRFPNLIIVALTQYLLFEQIISPTLQQQQIEPALDATQFLLFVLVTVLITAGGYIINDIVDLKIDQINKPDKVIVGKKIAHSTAYWLYFCINLLGFILAVFLAFDVPRTALLFLFPVAVIGLLFYSIILKKLPLWGNLLVSFYCAGVAYIIGIAESPALQKVPAIDLQKVTQLLTVYAIFAFLSTLFREIVKDMEDTQGDAQLQARTMPIAWGIRTAKTIATATAGLLILLLIFVAFTMQTFLLPFGNLFIGLIIILTGIAIFLLLQANNKTAYHRLSQFAKIIMLSGILLLLFFA